MRQIRKSNVSLLKFQFKPILILPKQSFTAGIETYNDSFMTTEKNLDILKIRCEIMKTCWQIRNQEFQDILCDDEEYIRGIADFVVGYELYLTERGG